MPTLPINKIERGQGESVESVNIGAAAEDVYITLSVNNEQEYITLADFAKYLYNYFETGTFLSYGTLAPTNANLNTKLWYDTSGN